MSMCTNYGQVTFQPRLNQQRYERVYKAIEAIIHESGTEDMSPKTVMDVGCSTLSFHSYLRHASFSVKKLIYLDKDEEMLQEVSSTLNGKSLEQLTRREGSLVAVAFAGSIEKFDPTILNEGPLVYCITAIEVIEHLDPDVLVGFERTVFGLIHPPVVILTTPNSEYNVVFGMKPGQVRIEDHRFEWTRAEFHEWCTKICTAYSMYAFTLEGIGVAENTEYDPSLGHASQMAVFRRRGNSTNWRGNTLSEEFMDDTVPGSFKLILRKDYGNGFPPATPDERIFIIVEVFIARTNLGTTPHGFHTSKSRKRKGKSTEGQTQVDIPFQEVFGSYGLPKGVYSFEQAGQVLEDAGYKIVKCGPNKDLGIRLPTDKAKITVPLKFLSSY